ncbi:MAG: DUF481 domain-containing protein [Ignavibacteriales bacterium]|nr:DUF481 domain-containing protein [Ignavibacteriales bacterium]
MSSKKPVLSEISFAFAYTEVENTDHEEEKTAEKYEFKAKTGYELANEWSLFVNAFFDRNVPAGMKERYSVASGLMKQFTIGQKQTLKAGCGLESAREKTVGIGRDYE